MSQQKDLPPVPYNTPVTGPNGLLTAAWQAFMRQLFTRVGKNVAPSNDELLLNPMTAFGDMIVGAAGGAASRLAGNTATTKKYLVQTGTGSAANTQVWDTISANDVPTLNQNTTGTAATATAPQVGSAHGIVTLDSSGRFQSVAPGIAGHIIRSNGTDYVDSAIQASDIPTLNQSTTGSAGSVSGTNVVTNSNLAQMAANTLKGNNSGVAANASDLTISQVQSMLFPAGMMAPYGGSAAPSGWLLCDGSAVSRTTYSALFSAIGTAYGAGNGSTTFNLPNTKGVFLRGAGSQTIGGITYSATLGASQNDQMQGHNHNLTSTTGADGSLHVGANASVGHSDAYTNSATSADVWYAGDPTADSHSNGTPRTGAETRPANISVNYIIKT